MTETRSQKVKRNVSNALMLQTLKLLLSFVNRIIFVKILGSSYLGINGLFSNVLSILSVADLGMYAVMMFSLYKPLAEKDEQKIATHVNAFNKIYNVIAIAVGVTGLLVMPFLKYIVNLPEQIDGIYFYYILMLANVVIGYLFMYKTTLLQADQKSYILDRTDMIVQMSLFLVQIVVLIITKNYAFYLGLTVVATLVSNVVKSKIVDKHYGYLSKTAPKLDKKEKNSLKENIKGVFLYRIGGVIQSNTDNILISIFVGTITVGYYSNYAMIILAVTGFATTLFNSLKASIGSYNTEASKEEQRKMFFVFEDYNYLLIGFCSVCFFALFSDFISLCFGGDYVLRIATLAVIVLNFYTSNIRQNLWVYRETTGLFSKVKHVTLVTAVINIVLSIVFGKLFGITGVVGATVISRMLYAWWREPQIIFKDYFKTSSRQYIMTYIIRILYVCLVAVVASWLSSLVVVDNDIIRFIMRAIVVAVLAASLLLLPVINKESLTLLKKAFRKGSR